MLALLLWVVFRMVVCFLRRTGLLKNFTGHKRATMNNAVLVSAISEAGFGMCNAHYA